MNRLLVAALILTAACGGSDGGGITPPPPKKPDPWVTIRLRDVMDTTTAAGRAHWHEYLLLTGPYDALNGIAWQGNLGLNDRQRGDNIDCISIGADSVGQRLITVAAFADTTTDALTAQAQFDSFVQQWYDGNHTLPSGWMVLTFEPFDAFESAQYQAGHGRTKEDPIKWNLDWTDGGTVTFTERTDNDAQCSIAFG